MTTRPPTDLPKLRLARPMQVPVSTDKLRLARHAQRVADLTFHVQHQLSLPSSAGSLRTASVLPLGIGISWYLDLRLIAGRGRELRLAVWPGSEDATPMRDAVTADLPRYQPPKSGGRCPVPGSRGGKCNERGRTYAHWVTDVTTGDYEVRQMCDMHLPLAKERLSQAPDPRANRGGVLLAVFPELDVHAIYRWARPDWREPGTSPVVTDAPPVRPALMVVRGDAS